MNPSSPTRQRPRRSAARAAMVVAGWLVPVALVPLTTACAQERTSPSAVAPLDHATSGTSTPAPTESAPPPLAPATDSDATAPDGPATGTAAEVVRSVLADYGTVLTDLSADPAGAPVPGSPARSRWEQVVDPGSPLSADVLDRLHRRATVDGVVVQPGSEGISYRHRLVAVDRGDGRSVDFTWCGWSPGIGRTIADGQVVDDQVAHATGTGRVELTDGRWRLTMLDQLELELLPPGSADPCPTDGVPGR